MIPFFDQNAHYFNYKEEIDAAIQKVLNSGQFILGEEVEAFEKEFSAYHQAKYGLGVANGTDAIFLALKALDVKEGDEVIVPNNTYVGTVNAVKMTGAIPVFSDHNQYYLIDVATIAEVLTSKTKAIVPVHLYGQMCDMESIVGFAQKHNLKVVEDAAQAHGAKYDGFYPGHFSDAATFSFYPTKNLGAFGDGGMIISNHSEVISKAKFYARQGLYLNEMQFEGGVNSRLDELQAAILRVKLRYLSEINSNRKSIAETYLKLLKEVAEIELPQVQTKASHTFHQFVIKVKNANQLRERFLRLGVPTEVHYPYFFSGEYKLIKNEHFLSLPLVGNDTESIVDNIKKELR